MLWDLVRDFFVHNVFGGIDTNMVRYGGFIGFNVIEELEYYTDDFMVSVNGTNICIGDWLSTTATIISISIIVILCCLFVYKIIKLIGGLIR